MIVKKQIINTLKRYKTETLLMNTLIISNVMKNVLLGMNYILMIN